MADWWMLSGTTSTSAGAMVRTPGGGDIKTADLGALQVTSEKASANLATRSVSVTIGSTAGSAFGSTSFGLWTAPAPATITAIKIAPLMAWTVATSGSVFEFWSCAAGVICTYNASTTAVMKTVGEVNSCFVLNSTGVNLTACETVRVKIALPGTTSCAQMANVQIDYVTSG
ncbi:MAG: hypothetical protein RLZZ200_2705 [Pseudomonadota bacterium]|jgi:hypothetical protein